jgi:O-antigen ligase
VGAQRYELGGKRFAVEESAAARFEVLKWVMPLWLKSPLFGYGVTGIGFVDGQYLLILGELGIIGLMAFFWIILRLFRSFLEIYRSSDDTWIQGISLGLISSLFALLVQNLGANVFIIVRVMEPFWFLAAMVLAMPHIKEEFSTVDIG